jgi:hypothetical protein
MSEAIKTPLEVLRAMRTLLERPQGWTQHTDARDADGQSVLAGSEAASSFCLTGAHRRVVVPYVLPTLRECLGHAPGDVGWQSWNDAPECTHADVLAMIDAAIMRWEDAGKGRDATSSSAIGVCRCGQALCRVHLAEHWAYEPACWPTGRYSRPGPSSYPLDGPRECVWCEEIEDAEACE